MYRKNNYLEKVHIVLVGKYTDMPDSYMSVVKSLEHSASRCLRKLELKVSIFCMYWVSFTLTVVGGGWTFGTRTQIERPGSIL